MCFLRRCVMLNFIYIVCSIIQVAGFIVLIIIDRKKQPLEMSVVLIIAGICPIIKLFIFEKVEKAEPIILIYLAALSGVIMIIFGIYFLIKWRKKKKTNNPYIQHGLGDSGDRFYDHDQR